MAPRPRRHDTRRGTPYLESCISQDRDRRCVPFFPSPFLAPEANVNYFILICYAGGLNITTNSRQLDPLPSHPNWTSNLVSCMPKNTTTPLHTRISSRRSGILVAGRRERALGVLKYMLCKVMLNLVSLYTAFQFSTVLLFFMLAFSA
jgi:hypothetical protein